MIETELQKIFVERVQQMCLMDDELFCAVFDGDIECTQYVLRIIMEKENLIVKSAVVQKTEANLIGRGVRFDVFAESDGVFYDIEVQRADEGAAPRRARYNSSMLDTNMLNKGDKFDELLETYVIFITERDVLKKNLPIYHINRRIDETGDLFDDGSHIIYVNGAYKDDTPLGRLMQDFSNLEYKTVNNPVLRKRMYHFKKTTKGLMTMSKIMQDIYDQGREEALEQGIEIGREEGIGIGREENRMEMIVNMLKYNQPVELISKIINMPVEKIISIGKEKGLIV